MVFRTLVVVDDADRRVQESAGHDKIPIPQVDKSEHRKEICAGEFSGAPSWLSRSS